MNAPPFWRTFWFYLKAHTLGFCWVGSAPFNSLVFCWNWLSGCLRPLQGRGGAGEKEKGRRESTALKFRWWQWNIAERRTSKIYLDMKSNGEHRYGERERLWRRRQKKKGREKERHQTVCSRDLWELQRSKKTEENKGDGSRTKQYLSRLLHISLRWLQFPQ